MNMSPKLRPLRLPLLVEERRKREEAQSDAGDDAPYRSYSLDSCSSDAPSPVTPTFSTRGHLRCSSSTSSFESTPATTSESPASPVQSAQLSSKRVLDDVQEEPHELEDFDNDDALSDQFDLCNCLNDEPCIRESSELVESPSAFYSGEQDIEYDLGCLSDSDFQVEQDRSRKRSISFTSLSQRLGSRLASLSRRRASRQRSIPSSPTPDFYDFDILRNGSRAASRAASSRSPSRSPSGRYVPDATLDYGMPPTPALSAYQSSESVALQESVDDMSVVNDLCASIQRERALANTPLLPLLPLMNGTPHSRSTALPSPLESPTVAFPYDSDSHSPTIISPPLSTKPSISSFRGLTSPVDLPSIPEPDAWSDRLGHANFTILPQPYQPEVADEFALHQFHLDWDSARVNYTKHLARTGEHYGVNSKTYVLTEAKWAEIDRTWRKLHDDVAHAVVASGVAAHCTQCDENIPTIMPNLNAEGKFPDRGDEDIVGPMVRQASMTDVDRKRPSLWRRFTGPLRK